MEGVYRSGAGERQAEKGVHFSCLMAIKVKIYKVYCPACSSKGVVNGPLPVRGKVLRCPRCGCRFRVSQHPILAATESEAVPGIPVGKQPPVNTPLLVTGKPDVAVSLPVEAPLYEDARLSGEGVSGLEDRKTGEPEPVKPIVKATVWRKMPLFLAGALIAVICLFPSGRMTNSVTARPVLLALLKSGAVVE